MSAVQTLWSVSRNVGVKFLTQLHSLPCPSARNKLFCVWEKLALNFFAHPTRTSALLARKHPWLRVRQGSVLLFRPPTRPGLSSLPTARKQPWRVDKKVSAIFSHTQPRMLPCRWPRRRALWVKNWALHFLTHMLPWRWQGKVPICGGPVKL